MKNPQTLRQKLQVLKSKQFTGKVDVRRVDGREWRLYFCLSRLIWADGGYHPYRAWQRLLTHYCPNLDLNLIDLNKAKQFECWNYYIIVTLLQRFLITKEQAIELIKARISEIIFDIYQAEHFEELEYNFIGIEGNFLEESGLKASVTLLKMETVLEKVEQRWQLWQEYKLQKWSPNFAPLIKNPVLLKEEISEDTYNKLVSLFNGKYPLRELGYKLKLDHLKIITWLKPYVKKGLVELVEVRDLSLKITLIGVTNHNYKITKTTHQKLIACIDDSVQICQIMEHIIIQAGYQYFSIQDPLKALPLILKRKPDLIFLDLVMPIVNGYEICSQIRRVSALKDVPVVILTSNDGMIDRIRSKIVGATAFLGKPINEDKVLDKINSLLLSSPTKSSSSVQKKLEFNTQTIS